MRGMRGEAVVTKSLGLHVESTESHCSTLHKTQPRETEGRRWRKGLNGSYNGGSGRVEGFMVGTEDRDGLLRIV